MNVMKFCVVIALLALVGCSKTSGDKKRASVERTGFWLWLDVVTLPSGTSAEQMRRLYGSLM